MIRMQLAIVFLLGVGAGVGCLQSHSAEQREVRGDDCVVCHMPDYQATVSPAHATSGYPTTCADCHQQTGWRPALGGVHPEPRFPIASSAHRNIACLTCHDLAAGPSQAGANTNCIQCHPNSPSQQASHVGARGPMNQPYEYSTQQRNFCLTCHPSGQAGRHPDDRFPRTRDHDAPCATCHDRSAGPDTRGGNTTCLTGGCHSLRDADEEHEDVGQYAAQRGNGSNRHFCLACHPDGRE